MKKKRIERILAEWGGAITLLEALNGRRQAAGGRVVVRHVYAVQSTIQREMGVTAVKIEFAIGGHSEHTRRQHVVLLLTLCVLIKKV